MVKNVVRPGVAALLVVLAGMASAQEISFKDPIGDDKGPGTYTYPTDAVYKPGSFDLTGFSMKSAGGKYDLEVSVNSQLEDPWRMGVGFSVQMVFVFIDTDHKEGSGFTKGLPGLNVQFAPADAWDRVIVLSPQSPGRVKSEVQTKAAAMASAVVVPDKVRGSGRKISASIPKSALPAGDPSTWGYQVIMQSNEGFPAATDLLTRKVNEYEGQHRFGGGNDGDCDPHVMDLLAGEGKGDPGEVKAQYEMLAYDCATGKLATLTMVRKQK